MVGVQVWGRGWGFLRRFAGLTSVRLRMSSAVLYTNTLTPAAAAASACSFPALRGSPPLRLP